MIQSKSKKVQHLVALLKAHNIKHMVCSPGNRNVQIVHALESDPFFKTYCVTDERSAAFFALGIIEKLGEPCAVCCTSGTALANYASAVSEAYYQRLPLLVISADRNPAYLNQREDQMIPQIDILKSVCKKSVSLPIEEDEKSMQYSNLLLNEALLELCHHGSAPVHINIPFEADMGFSEDIASINVRCIRRHDINNKNTWKDKLTDLPENAKILVIYGQAAVPDGNETAAAEAFAKKFNCIFAVDHLSNYHGYASINTFYSSKIMSEDAFSKIAPDIVISINGNFTSYIRSFLKSSAGSFQHWLVCEDGNVADPFRSLTDIFECSTAEFFSTFVTLADKKSTHSYLEKWQEQMQYIDNAELPYSDIYAVQQFIKRVPANSLLHLGNSTSVRLAQHFSLEKSVEVYCNRGTNGIDGSMSAFIGQAMLHDGLAFLLIGDLSFFYDMNGLWNRYVGKNVRILLNNNSGATLFHYIIGTEKIPTLNNVTSAEHFAVAKGWVESQGMKYLCAHSKEELDAVLPEFMSKDSDAPIVLEVFTSKEEDAKILKSVYVADRKETVKDKLKSIINRR